MGDGDVTELERLLDAAIAELERVAPRAIVDVFRDARLRTPYLRGKR